VGGCTLRGGQAGETLPQATTLTESDEQTTATWGEWQVCSKAILNAAQEEVFTYVSDPIGDEPLKGFSATADHSASSSGADKTGVGSVFRAEYESKYEGLNITKTVTYYQPPNRIDFDQVIEWKGNITQLRSVMETKRISDGKTELTVSSSRVSGPKVRFAWLVKFRRQHQLNLAVDQVVEEFGGQRIK
jgi:hypothetical protein